MIFLSLALCWGLGGSAVAAGTGHGDCVIGVTSRFFASFASCGASARPVAEDWIARHPERKWYLAGHRCGPEIDPEGLDI